jgi:hypothetical protein
MTVSARRVFQDGVSLIPESEYNELKELYPVRSRGQERCTQSADCTDGDGPITCSRLAGHTGLHAGYHGAGSTILYGYFVRSD